jgi:hypothetical protein
MLITIIILLSSGLPSSVLPGPGVAWDPAEWVGGGLAGSGYPYTEDRSGSRVDGCTDVAEARFRLKACPQPGAWAHDAPVWCSGGVSEKPPCRLRSRSSAAGVGPPREGTLGYSEQMIEAGRHPAGA